MSREDPFTCLGLPGAFKLSPEALDAAYHRVLSLTHPDRFVGRSGPEKLAASLQASAANAAYQTLKSFYTRACAYLALHPPSFDETSPPDSAFLGQVMEYQERLESGEGAALKQELTQALHTLERNVEDLLEEQDFTAAARLLAQYKYLERLLQQASRISQVGDQAAGDFSLSVDERIPRGA